MWRNSVKEEKVKYRDYIFDFEKLDVYRMALEFVNEIFAITLEFRKEIQLCNMLYRLGCSVKT